MSGFAANLHLTSGGVYLYSAISLRRKVVAYPPAHGGVSLHANLFLVLRGQFPKLVKMPGLPRPEGSAGERMGHPD